MKFVRIDCVWRLRSSAGHRHSIEVCTYRLSLTIKTICRTQTLNEVCTYRLCLTMKIICRTQTLNWSLYSYISTLSDDEGHLQDTDTQLKFVRIDSLWRLRPSAGHRPSMKFVRIDCVWRLISSAGHRHSIEVFTYRLCLTIKTICRTQTLNEVCTFRLCLTMKIICTAQTLNCILYVLTVSDF